MATKKTLTALERRALARYADTAGAKGYGAWLGRTLSDADQRRQASATSALLDASLHTGKGGRLASLGLAEDGYAAYLRRAAKEARSERDAAAEALRVSAGTEALRGYADYLAKVRKEDEERLNEAAEALVSTPHTEAEAGALIARTTRKSGARAALERLYRTRGTTAADTDSEKTEKVLERIGEARMPYARAYEYCRLLGYSEEMAKRLASFASEPHDSYTEKLHELFGYT